MLQCGSGRITGLAKVQTAPNKQLNIYCSDCFRVAEFLCEWNISAKVLVPCIKWSSAEINSIGWQLPSCTGNYIPVIFSLSLGVLRFGGFFCRGGFLAEPAELFSNVTPEHHAADQNKATHIKLQPLPRSVLIVQNSAFWHIIKKSKLCFEARSRKWGQSEIKLASSERKHCAKNKLSIWD